MSGGICGKLTDKAVKAFVAKAQRGKKLPDGGGLHLFITPAGGDTWRIKYRIDGKEKIYSIGSRVPLFHRSCRPIYAPAAQEGRRRATDNFTLMDEVRFPLF